MRAKAASRLPATADHHDAQMAAEASLRALGHRMTATRRLVLDVVLGDEEHRTAEQIASAVRRRDPGVHRSTVYRTLDALESAGVLVHVHLGHGSATYHRPAAGHHHAVCDRCGAVVELPTRFLDDAARWLERQHGFTAVPAHFALVGRCVRCSEQGPVA